ncbi:YraN family protein [Candidatus Thiosymbion oneisti]|uniref:YraN family protein n=1 Tax=Candidatus Thiosymbion oneisti TaxID=589554 RepID=UPI000AE24E3C|nr:YraN family protein [Candidatus Thiosymbion oneisti]
MPIPTTNRLARSGGDTERLACTYLQAEGLRLLEPNYRCRRGEIDLVMREGDTLVFVEVRFRASSRFGTPAETVNIHKQHRLAAAAAHYLRYHPTKLACRFDVIAVSGNNHINWIRNAFNVQ